MTHFTDEEHQKFIYRLAASSGKQDKAALASIAAWINSGNASMKEMRRAWEHIEDTLMLFPDSAKP